MKNLWTKRKIVDYLSHPDKSLDKNYSPIRQKYRKELRRMGMETKAKGGEVDIKEAIEFQEERINALEGKRIIDVEAN